MNLFNRNIIAIKGRSKKVSENFKDESLDLVYVDGGHDAGNISWDYAKWLPKIRTGGHILFHDTCPAHEHVHKFVNDIVAADPTVEEVHVDIWGPTIIRAFKKVEALKEK